MFRDMKNLEQLIFFDSCIYTIRAMLKKDCSTCPLCEDSIDKIMDHILLHSRTKFISYSSRYPLIVALRLSVEETLKDEISFKKDNYPITESLNQIATRGTCESRLWTQKSFYHFYKASVNPKLYIKMILADFARFSIKT